MTKEEAIKAIKANYPSGGYEDLRKALDIAIKALEDSRWIPVTERLPEEEKWYPCTIEGHDINGNRMRIEDTCSFVNGKFFSNSGIEYNVVAWREPKPYEEGAEE